MWPGETIYVVNRQGDYLIHPDRSREFGSVLGKPTDKQARYYAGILAGERAAIAAMKPGVPVSQLFDIAVRVTRENGVPHYQRHPVVLLVLLVFFALLYSRSVSLQNRIRDHQRRKAVRNRVMSWMGHGPSASGSEDYPDPVASAADAHSGRRSFGGVRWDRSSVRCARASVRTAG